ncbi:IclR family transcriptional regulator [Tenacibaculum agarivorans]|uniref:IclR family transcriptional regulator n=1 Tax=Tenacibaculum agarivorans TaxID=1908389 RepID=UPI00094BBA08|nr:IclR family transcriptional regulator [Tenacibaculum agarivorans]
MSKYNAPALDKGLDILEYLSHKAIPQSQVEIAKGIERNPNEFYRMLVSLEERGYIAKDPSSGKFSLTLKLFQLSHSHSPIDGLLNAAKPIMEKLSHATNQSCHLSIIKDHKLMVISQTKSPGPVSLSIEEGSLFPLIKTASGKLILSFLSAKKRDQILKKDSHFLDFSKEEKQKFLAQLSTIKTDGFILQQSDLNLGVTDLSVPIGNPKTGLFGALAISSLINVSKEQDSSDFMIEEILKASSSINQAIGLQKI